MSLKRVVNCVYLVSKNGQYGYQIRGKACTRLHLVHIGPHLAYRRGRLSLEGVASWQHTSSSSD